jgi:hypothetical protein
VHACSLANPSLHLGSSSMERANEVRRKTWPNTFHTYTNINRPHVFVGSNVLFQKEKDESKRYIRKQKDNPSV